MLPEHLRYLYPLLDIWRCEGYTIGFTNGCFDAFHEGHRALLEAAHLKCDRLIISINSDASVRRLKGPNRPLVSEAKRLQSVVRFMRRDRNLSPGVSLIWDNDSPLELIEHIRPRYLFKGGDYLNKHIIGADFVEMRSGNVVIIPRLEGFSTTGIMYARGTLSTSM